MHLRLPAGRHRLLLPVGEIRTSSNNWLIIQLIKGSYQQQNSAQFNLVTPLRLIEINWRLLLKNLLNWSLARVFFYFSRENENTGNLYCTL